MQYVRGAENVVPDCLSRPFVNSVTVDFCDLQAIACHQKNDDEINQFNDQLKSFTISNNLKLWCEMSTSYPSPFVPQQDRLSFVSI